MPISITFCIYHASVIHDLGSYGRFALSNRHEFVIPRPDLMP